MLMFKLRPSTNRSLLILLVAIVLIMSLLNPRRFPTLLNLISMSYQLPVIAFLSIGMAITMLSGGINLAIIATANFTGIVTILLLQALVGEAMTDASVLVTLLAMGGGLAAALLIGAIMGFLIAYVEVPAILSTLAVMTLLNGVNIVITRGYTLSGFPPFLLGIGNETVWGIPIPVIIMIVIAVIAHIVTRYTPFGLHVYSTGGNEETTRLAGISPDRIKLAVYMISGVLAALGGVLLTARLWSAQPNAAAGWELDAIAAPVLGGTSLFGGVGSIGGTVIGAFIIGVLSNGLNLMGVPSYYQQVIKGLVLILAVTVDLINKRRR